jgi:hypothetical protein
MEGDGSGMEKIRICGWKNLGSGINIQDPQHLGTIIWINKTKYGTHILILW